MCSIPVNCVRMRTEANMRGGLIGDTCTHQTQFPALGERAIERGCGLQSCYLDFKMRFGGCGCIVCRLFC